MMEQSEYSRLIECVEKYAIGDIVDLEELVNGQEVQIELTEPVIDKENGKTYTIDGVKLKLEKYNLLELNKTSLKSGEFDDFFVRFSDDVIQTKLQKLNYSDFINKKNDLVGVVDFELSQLENRILKIFKLHLNENLSTPHYSRHLLNKIILPKISFANHWLETNYIKDSQQILFPFYKKFSTFQELVPALTLVFQRQQVFLNLLKEEFAYYYDKSEFEEFLERHSEELESQSEKNIPRRTKIPNWEKVARILIKSNFTYEKRGKDVQREFYYNDKKFKNATSLSKELKGLIDIKQDAIRNVLTQTFNNIDGKNNSNNIFIQTHLQTLKKMISVLNPNEINPVFSQKIKEMEEKNL